MAEILQILSIISFAIAGVLFLLAILFWFVFGIPTVIGDLSGRTARKSIAKMRALNEKSGAKSHRVSAGNAQRPKLTQAPTEAPKAAKTTAEKPLQKPAAQKTSAQAPAAQAPAAQKPAVKNAG